VKNGGILFNKKAPLAVLAIIFAIAVLAVFMLYQPQTQLAASKPQPPTPILAPNSEPVPTAPGDQGSEAVNIALADSTVKQYLDKGYEVYGVFKQVPAVYTVCILTQQQRLPYVLGITLKAQIDADARAAQSISYDLTLANLTDKQKAETQEIASNYVDSTYGKDYALQQPISVACWETSGTGNFTFHAYPEATFRTPADWSKPGEQIYAYVDINKREIANTFSLPSKPMRTTTP
jgi:hypothetical protein